MSDDARTFPPPPDLAAHANVTEATFTEAAADDVAFWAEQAGRLSWGAPPTETLDWSNAPFAQWYADGTLNAAYNCLDRHVEAGLGDRVAFHFEGEPGDRRTITYAELTAQVCQAANALTELGVKAGDRVAIYLPMIPEAAVAMLACARLGAPHTVVFGGFSSDALATRILDCGVEHVITADGGWRKGKSSALKPAVDEALERCPDVQNVLVIRRTGQETAMVEGRDVWWHDLVESQSTEHAYETFPAEHPLYIMYTSGSTGKPKGILHTTGGYLVGVAYTHWATFDLKAETDVFWTAADIGWVTGHSYLVYGPLANGATSVMYEGTPDSPHQGRWWEIIDHYGVTILYCAPTAIRTFMKWGADIPAKYDLSSLRILGSVGEPINPEAYLWYREHIGHDRTPVVDTWWQTETGMHMISPMPGVADGKPGAAMRAVPGISVKVVNDEGVPISDSSDSTAAGYLVIDKPWPAMLRGIWGDEQRYIDTYWSPVPRRLLRRRRRQARRGRRHLVAGRVDDVMNVVRAPDVDRRDRVGARVDPKVAEAAVVGATDDTTGQAIVAFVILRSEAGDGGPDVVAELRKHVAKEIGPIAGRGRSWSSRSCRRPGPARSSRRLLRDVAENRELGDVTTLTDSSVMDLIKGNLATSSSED